MTKLKYAFILMALSIITSCGSEFEEEQNSPTTYELAPPHQELYEDLVFATQKQINDHEVVENSYIVAFKPDDHDQKSNASTPKTFKDSFAYYFPKFYEKTLSKSNVLKTRFLGKLNLNYLPFVQKNTLATNKFLDPILPGVHDASNHTPQTTVYIKVQFNDNEEAIELLEEWKTNDIIWTAEPEYKSKLSYNYSDYINNAQLQQKYLAAGSPTAAIKLDTAFTGLQQLSATIPTIDNVAPVIAVFDSGTDFNHAGISQSVWTNPRPNVLGCGNDVHGCNTTKAFRDTIGDGHVNPTGTDISYSGTSACTSSGGASDCDHGTHVAGIIAGDPLKGAIATCLTCKIMTIKIVKPNQENASSSGSIEDSAIIAGLNYITKFQSKTTEGSKIRVVNMSFGKFSASKAVASYVRVLHDVHGTTMVAASGNEDTVRFNYPAAYPEVISVAALNTTLGSQASDFPKSTFSNFGPWVDIAAPGTEIISLVTGGGTNNKRGTSQATPFVAGVIGLMNARDPTITPAEVRRILLTSADSSIYKNQINSNYSNLDPTSPSPLLGYGLLDAGKAIDFAQAEGLDSVENDRVPSMCGVVSHENQSNNLLLFCLMSIPFWLAVFSTKKKLLTEPLNRK